MTSLLLASLFSHMPGGRLLDEEIRVVAKADRVLRRLGPLCRLLIICRAGSQRRPLGFDLSDTFLHRRCTIEVSLLRCGSQNAPVGLEPRLKRIARSFRIRLVSAGESLLELLVGLLQELVPFKRIVGGKQSQQRGQYEERSAHPVDSVGV